MPAKLGTNYGTGITRCAVWNRSIISSTNSLETANSTLIKFPIQHLVHKLRYLLRFRGKRRSKEERLSRQFCTKTKFHIQKKRGTESKTIRVFRLFENRRGKIRMSRRCAATGMQRGVLETRSSSVLRTKPRVARLLPFPTGEKMVLDWVRSICPRPV